MATKATTKKKTPAKKTTTKKAPVKKTVAKKTPAKKAPVKRAAPKKKEVVTVKGIAVIPTGQYANAQPEITGYGETQEQAMADWVKNVAVAHELAGSVAPIKPKIEAPKESSVQTTSNIKYERKICVASGAEVLFDPAEHKYVDNQGNKYIGGSTFAHKFVRPFDAEEMAPRVVRSRMVNKDATDEEVNELSKKLIEAWDLNGDTSKAFGTAIHAALECYGRYNRLDKVIPKKGETMGLHKNPLIRPIVETFFEGRENEVAIYEAFVAAPEFRICGFIDRLLVVDPDKKIVRVQDYKTNPDINKRCDILPPFKGMVDQTVLGNYWIQLSAYATILELHGWIVEGLDIFNFDGEAWTFYQSDIIEVLPEFRKLIA